MLSFLGNGDLATFSQNVTNYFCLNYNFACYLHCNLKNDKNHYCFGTECII